MQDARITHIGTYTHAQRGSMALREHAIGLSVSGLRRFAAHGLDVYDPGPALMITPAGCVHTFEYDATRENHVLIFSWKGLRPAARPGMVEWCDGGQWIQLPLLTPITPAEAAAWQVEWMRMKARLASPVPANLLLVRVALMRIVGAILERSEGTRHAAPAEELRRRIDADTACRESIAGLSRACGYSADHLREVFHAAYGMSPRDYRLRRRVALAVELMANSRLTVKEMARHLGFRHVSHFSMLLRERTGESPSAAIRRLRQLRGAGSG